MDTIDDFLQKYKNTFVFLKLKENEEPTLVEFIENDGTKSLTFHNPTIGKIDIQYNTAWEKLSFKFPKKGLYNIPNKGFVLAERYPDRQYKRAPCNRNFLLTHIYGGTWDLAVNFEHISKCFYPIYPKNKEQAEKLIQKVGMVALSPEFGITIGDTQPYNLFYHRQFIGTINEKNEINLFYEPLRQETIDFFGDKLVWTN